MINFQTRNKHRVIQIHSVFLILNKIKRKKGKKIILKIGFLIHFSKQIVVALQLIMSKKIPLLVGLNGTLIKVISRIMTKKMHQMKKIICLTKLISLSQTIKVSYSPFTNLLQDL